MARTSTHAGSVAAPTIGLNDRVGVEQGRQGWSPPLDQPKAPRIDRRGTVEEARSRRRGRRSVPGSGGAAISRLLLSRPHTGMCPYGSRSSLDGSWCRSCPGFCSIGCSPRAPRWEDGHVRRLCAGAETLVRTEPTDLGMTSGPADTVNTVRDLRLWLAHDVRVRRSHDLSVRCLPIRR